tara:strand:+ start:247 stop:543 length:297 start_codon:yes stop_codon:yes gene_type:complete
MKKSNWREELDAPSAVKKTINEFVDGGAVTVPTAVVATTAAGTATAPAWLPLAVGGAAVAGGLAATRKKKKKECDDDCKKDKGHIPSNFKTGTIKNPQ